MLYDELKNLTKGEATVKEYEIVNKVYMDMEAMTKEEAADLWKYLFGKKHREAKREKVRIEAQCHDLKWVLDFIGDRTGEITLPNGEVIDVVWNGYHGVVRIDHFDFYHGKRTIAEKKGNEMVAVPRRYFKKV